MVWLTQQELVSGIDNSWKFSLFDFTAWSSYIKTAAKTFDILKSNEINDKSTGGRIIKVEFRHDCFRICEIR